MLAAPASDDLIPVVDVSAANTLKRATLTSVVGNIANNNLTMSDNAVLSVNSLVLRSTLSPTNSGSLTIDKGTLFFDSNYLYVAVANNLVKRVALSSF